METKKVYSPKMALSMTILCVITGVLSIGGCLFASVQKDWIFAILFLVIAIRQIIVFPRWTKMYKQAKTAA